LRLDAKLVKEPSSFLLCPTRAIVALLGMVGIGFFVAGIHDFAFLIPVDFHNLQEQSF
jgi:hypothetical protein